MQEQQSDDFYIPSFLLKMPTNPMTNWRETQTEDFLKGVQGWTEYVPVDECAE